MTRYRLKDRELQKKLDEISGGSFTESLESIKKPSCIVFQARNGGPAMSVNLTKQDIEQFLEYNPNDWNVFPDVTPPEGVLMRVEVENSYGEVSRECAIFQVNFPSRRLVERGMWSSNSRVLQEKSKTFPTLGVRHERDQNRVAQVSGQSTNKIRQVSCLNPISYRVYLH